MFPLCSKIFTFLDSTAICSRRTIFGWHYGRCLPSSSVAQQLIADWHRKKYEALQAVPYSRNEVLAICAGCFKKDKENIKPKLLPKPDELRKYHGPMDGPWIKGIDGKYPYAEKCDLCGGSTIFGAYIKKEPQ